MPEVTIRIHNSYAKNLNIANCKYLEILCKFFDTFFTIYVNSYNLYKILFLNLKESLFM